MLDSYLSALCQYAVRTGLIQTDDVVCCRNALLEALALDSFDEAAAPAEAPLAELFADFDGRRRFARRVPGQSDRARSVRHEAHGRSHAPTA